MNDTHDGVEGCLLGMMKKNVPKPSTLRIGDADRVGEAAVVLITPELRLISVGVPLRSLVHARTGHVVGRFSI